MSTNLRAPSHATRVVSARDTRKRRPTCRKYYIHPAVFECYSANAVPAVFASADAEPAALETALLKLVTAAAAGARASQ